MKIYNNGKVKAWTDGVLFEEQAKVQVANIAGLPFIFKHVAVMPDVHLGKGATVGSVIATKGAIIPAAVGVDIGCGMIAVKTNIAANHLPDNLKDIRNEIERLVPHGKTFGKRDNGAWTNPPNSHIQRHKNLCFPGQYDKLCELYPKLRHDSILEQFGTLGGGNHFVEICLDEENNIWIMLHSGSRGPGNRIGHFFIEKAKKLMEKYFIDLPDKELAYLPQGEELYNHYWWALDWAQNYAKQNRFAMLYNVLVALSKYFSYLDFSFDETVINCHHNYVSRENHYGENVMVARKGAVSAKEGQLGIIPGSMGAKSYIVKGKGNKESFTSCSHGAGRTLSRTKAKKEFTIEDHEKATAGVECRKDKDVIDETPGAYKDIDAVMEAQKDLVEVVHTLKQIICVKG